MKVTNKYVLIMMWLMQLVNYLLIWRLIWFEKCLCLLKINDSVFILN